MFRGRRFDEPMHKDALAFSSSLAFDAALMEYDIACSRAHAAMLGACRIIPEDDAAALDQGLEAVRSEYLSGKWKPDPQAFEDVHAAVEARLFETAGAVAGKLHTGRSRNDQVATDIRMWVKDACRKCRADLKGLQGTMVSLAGKHVETVIPGYTHLQRAQPISLAFHLLAYVEMFERSKLRFRSVFSEADHSPLGCGALAGSSLPLDRIRTAGALGFSNICRNALDAVSDRDFAMDFLNACVLCMMHLSRLSEELVLWSSAEWHFIRIGDAFTTGSSMMPQKKNPDMAELIRGKSGRVYGNYVSLATTLKGLPLSYNRDMQEDKKPLFDSFDTVHQCLVMMNEMLQTIHVDVDRFTKELDGDYCLATDLAERLVQYGLPFRKTHEIVGALIRTAESQHKKLHALTAGELQDAHPLLTEDIVELFSISSALKRKRTVGSPNPDLVNGQIRLWKEILEGEQR